MKLNISNLHINLDISNNICDDCYIGNRGYTIPKKILTNKQIENIKNHLTVKPRIMGKLSQEHSYPVYLESINKLYVPKFWGIINVGFVKQVKLNIGNDINCNFNGELREYQNNVIDNYLKSINYYGDDNNIVNDNQVGSSIINLGCGKGKTVIAIKIISIIKKKTIIFVHKTFLKDQWIERINQFMPNASIGYIQGQQIDIENRDIVIAMIQSISMKEYPVDLFKDFGFSIYDEVHHTPSHIFSNCFKQVNTIYSLGMTATIERKDGLSHILNMYLGDICYRDVSDLYTNVLVKVIHYKIDNNEYNSVELDNRGQVKYSNMISKISNFNHRSDFIIKTIINELYINPKQQFIVLSHNRSTLNYFSKQLLEKNQDVGFYVGGMRQQDLKNSENCTIILATYSMAAEALDIKSLTTLVLVTPKTDIVQAVGRILRSQHEQPLIIDIVDHHSIFLNQFTKRKRFYNSNKYNIIEINSDKYLETIESKDLSLSLWKKYEKTNKKNTKCLI